MQTPNITVVICTRNRAESLRITLECLSKVECSDIRMEAVVVDNASEDHTRQVVDELSRYLRIRYLHEPTLGTYGKSHALNCALDSGELGELIAVLDDDMSVAPDWGQGVLAISHRWPQAQLFTGRSHVVWPCRQVPAWARHSGIQGWLFSVQNSPASDRPLEEGHWFSGNHFWMRRQVFDKPRRFEDTWLTEPNFILGLVRDGVQGIQGPDASVGHRIQPQMLDPLAALRRAELTGQAFAEVRLDPRNQVRHSRLAHKHPGLARCYALSQWARWHIAAMMHSKAPTDSLRFGDRLVALEREANFRRTWQILNQNPEYRLFPRRQSAR